MWGVGSRASQISRWLDLHNHQSHSWRSTCVRWRTSVLGGSADGRRLYLMIYLPITNHN
jgi:hypothetical protein